MSGERDFFWNSGWKTQHIEETVESTEAIHNLIVWNDDVNTFDWVIESLVDLLFFHKDWKKALPPMINHLH